MFDDYDIREIKVDFWENIFLQENSWKYFPRNCPGQKYFPEL